MMPLLLACAASDEPGESAAFDALEIEVDVGDRPFTLFAGGDTDIGNAYRDDLDELGPDYPFEGLDPILGDIADVKMLNFETVALDTEGHETVKDGIWSHYMNPEWLPVLPERDLTLVTLANNHAMDWRASGMEEMLGHLDDNGIASFGAGMDLEEAWRPVVLDAGHTRVGLLGVFHYKESYERIGFYATDSSAGVANAWDPDLPVRVQALREHVDVVVLQVHWGTNYEPVEHKQLALAGWFADAGVDVVIGHGAHFVQAPGMVDDVPVLYSLGNFVFTTWGGFEELELSTLSRLTFADGATTRIELLPIMSNNVRTKFQPRPATEEEASLQLEPLLDASGMPWSAAPDEEGWYSLEL